jgi:hypothetical protein
MAARHEVIRCQCGQSNRRVLGIEKTGIFTCGKCGKPLLSVVRDDNNNSGGVRALRKLLLIGLFIAIVAVPLYATLGVTPTAKRIDEASKPVSAASSSAATRREPPVVAPRQDYAAKATPAPISFESWTPPPFEPLSLPIPAIASPPGLRCYAKGEQDCKIDSECNLVRLCLAGSKKCSAARCEPRPSITDGNRTAAKGMQPIDTEQGRSDKVAPQPLTGDIQKRVRKNGIAPFKIETEVGASYLMKLVSVTNAKDQIVIFVRGGETYSTKVPLGRYYLRAATGDTWYGREDLFGPRTQYFRLRNKDNSAKSEATTLQFRREGRTIHGATISLKRVVGGNMEQEVMNRRDFDAD